VVRPGVGFKGAPPRPPRSGNLRSAVWSSLFSGLFLAAGPAPGTADAQPTPANPESEETLPRVLPPLRLGEAAPRAPALPPAPPPPRLPRAAIRGAGPPIEDPTGTLDHVHRRLAAAARGRPDAVVRISVYSDSINGADWVTSALRRGLQERFGDAGKGFVPVARGWPSQVHQGIAVDEGPAWRTDVVNRGARRDGRYGLGGVIARGGGPGARTSYRLPEATHRVQVLYRAHRRGGVLGVRVDDLPPAVERQEEQALGSPAPLLAAAVTRRPPREDIAGPSPAGGAVSSGASAPVSPDPRAAPDPSGAPGPAPGDGVLSAHPPPGSGRELTVGWLGEPPFGPLDLYGVVFERGGPGVVVDALMMVGAFARTLLRFDPGHWAGQVAARAPDLLVFWMGGNDAVQDAVGFSRGRFVDGYAAAIATARRGRPEASCLVVSVLDSGERDEVGRARTQPRVPRVVAAQREVAERTGCAFYDLFRAVGGEGTMARWVREASPRVSGDLKHLTPRGAHHVGHLLERALLRSYDAWLEDRSED